MEPAPDPAPPKDSEKKSPDESKVENAPNVDPKNSFSAFVVKFPPNDTDPTGRSFQDTIDPDKPDSTDKRQALAYVRHISDSHDSRPNRCICIWCLVRRFVERLFANQLPIPLQQEFVKFLHSLPSSDKLAFKTASHDSRDPTTYNHGLKHHELNLQLMQSRLEMKAEKESDKSAKRTKKNQELKLQTKVPSHSILSMGISHHKAPPKPAPNATTVAVGEEAAHELSPPLTIDKSWELVLDCIIGLNLPFSVIESPLFRALLYGKFPLKFKPYRKKFVKKLKQRSDALHQSKLEGREGDFWTLVFDEWVRPQRDSLVLVLMVFGDGKFVVVSVELLPRAHILGDELAHVYLPKWIKAAHKMNPTGTMVNVCCDNASTNVKGRNLFAHLLHLARARAEVYAGYPEDAVPQDVVERYADVPDVYVELAKLLGDMPVPSTHPCMAHQSNLLTVHALKDDESPNTPVYLIHEFLREISIAYRKFKATLNRITGSTRAVTLGSDTRWSSHPEMIHQHLVIYLEFISKMTPDNLRDFLEECDLLDYLDFYSDANVWTKVPHIYNMVATLRVTVDTVQHDGATPLDAVFAIEELLQRVQALIDDGSHIADVLRRLRDAIVYRFCDEDMLPIHNFIRLICPCYELLGTATQPKTLDDALFHFSRAIPDQSLAAKCRPGFTIFWKSLQADPVLAKRKWDVCADKDPRFSRDPTQVAEWIKEVAKSANRRMTMIQDQHLDAFVSSGFKRIASMIICSATAERFFSYLKEMWRAKRNQLGVTFATAVVHCAMEAKTETVRKRSAQIRSSHVQLAIPPAHQHAELDADDTFVRSSSISEDVLVRSVMDDEAAEAAAAGRPVYDVDGQNYVRVGRAPPALEDVRGMGAHSYRYLPQQVSNGTVVPVVGGSREKREVKAAARITFDELGNAELVVQRYSAEEEVSGGLQRQPAGGDGNYNPIEHGYFSDGEDSEAERQDVDDNVEVKTGAQKRKAADDV
jgi:hypothetical protein